MLPAKTYEVESRIRKAFQPSPEDIVACTVGGWIGTGIWAAVLWKLNKPLESVLGYVITMAVCLYGVVIVAFFKQRTQHRRQYEDTVRRLETAECEADAAEARRAFAERLLEASEDKVEALEAQLGVGKRHRASRMRQFKHYG